MSDFQPIAPPPHLLKKFSAQAQEETKIQPPPELVREWVNNHYGGKVHRNLGGVELSIATQAAQWGAAQELEACCEMTPEHFDDLTELHHITCAAAFALKSLDGRLECTGESEHFTHEDVAGCVYSIKRLIDMLDQIIKLQGLKGDWIYPDMHPAAEDDVDLFLEQ
jgi:hypothetical protein